MDDTLQTTWLEVSIWCYDRYVVDVVMQYWSLLYTRGCCLTVVYVVELWGRARHTLPESINGSTLRYSSHKGAHTPWPLRRRHYRSTQRRAATPRVCWPQSSLMWFLETALESRIEGSLPAGNVDPNSEILVAEKSVRLWFSCLILRGNYFERYKEGICLWKWFKYYISGDVDFLKGKPLWEADPGKK